MRTLHNSLSYLGVEAKTPPNFTIQKRAPLTSDYRMFELGDIWLEKATDNIWVLTSKQLKVATWTDITAGSGTGLITCMADVDFATVNVSRKMTITGGTNINTSGSGEILTVNLDTSISLPATSADGSSGLYSIDSKTFMHAHGIDNTFLGENAGNLTLTVVDAVKNTGIGTGALYDLTRGEGNVGVGYQALAVNSIGDENTGIGSNSLELNETGNENCALGFGALSEIVSGNFNIAIGSLAGADLTTNDSNNILISNMGSVGLNNTIIIGTQGTGDSEQDTCIIAGIYNTVPAVGADNVVAINSDGELGGLAAGTEGQLLTAHGAGFPLTWETGTGGVVTYPVTVAKGDVLVATATNVVSIVAGATTDGFVLTANGATTVPTFRAVPGAGIVNSVSGGTNINMTGTAVDVITNLDDAITLSTVNATTFDTNFAAEALTLTGTSLIADGINANIDINITPKGTGSILTTNIDADNIASDYFVTSPLDANIYLNGTSIIADGTDTDIDINITPKGTGSLLTTDIEADNIASDYFITSPLDANIYLNGTSIIASGTNADISINITSKGTGHVVLDSLNVSDFITGVLISGGTGDITSLTNGTEGQVLTAHGAGLAVTWESSPGATYCSDAEAIAGIVTDKSVAPSTLSDKLGAQTSHGIAYGSGTTGAVAWTAELNDGELVIGDNTNIPKVASLTAGTGISVTNAAGSITLAATGTTFNDQVGTTYVLELTDAGKIVSCTNASAITLTIPTNAAVSFPIGTEIILVQYGAGALSVTPDGGVTLNSASSYRTLYEQYSAAALIKKDTDLWILVGDIK